MSRTTEARAFWKSPANLMSMVRIILAVPIILLVLIQPAHWSGIAGTLFAIAAWTDTADGFLARRYDNVTSVGQWLDPLADKILVIPLLVTLSLVEFNGEALVPILVSVTVVFRELVISLIRYISVQKGNSFPASWSGKLKMVAQTMLIGITLYWPSIAADSPVRIFAYCVAGLTILSGADYLLRARREIFCASPSIEITPIPSTVKDSVVGNDREC